MVPFGKAAFFPGRLVHTNEFKVLLGEGYYVDRTSKQTIDILNRRGKALGKQVESLKATMEDFKAQASFFDNTASEALEGLVEIVEEEEDVKEGSSKPLFNTGSVSSQSSQTVEEAGTKDAAGDDDYARIEALFAELEKAEAAANSDDDGDKEVEVEDGDEDEEEEEQEEEEEEDEDDDDEQIQNAVDYRTHQSRSPQAQVDASRLQEVTEVVPLHKNYLAPKTSVMVNNPLEAHKVMNKVQSPLPASNTGIIGSIVEHDTGLYSEEHQIGARNMKLVSRFKMQRKE